MGKVKIRLEKKIKWKKVVKIGKNWIKRVS